MPIDHFVSEKSIKYLQCFSVIKGTYQALKFTSLEIVENEFLVKMIRFK